MFVGCRNKSCCCCCCCCRRYWKEGGRLPQTIKPEAPGRRGAAPPCGFRPARLERPQPKTCGKGTAARTAVAHGGELSDSFSGAYNCCAADGLRLLQRKRGARWWAEGCHGVKHLLGKADALHLDAADIDLLLSERGEGARRHLPCCQPAEGCCYMQG